MGKKIKQIQEIHFLNVDVEIRASFDLKPVLKKLGSKVIKMYCGETNENEFLLALELADFPEKNTPDVIIKRFCKLFEKKVKKDLQKVDSIVFDIGYDSGKNPHCLRNVVSAKTLKKVTELNAELAISIYALYEDKTPK